MITNNFLALTCNNTIAGSNPYERTAQKTPYTALPVDKTIFSYNSKVFGEIDDE